MTESEENIHCNPNEVRDMPTDYDELRRRRFLELDPELKSVYEQVESRPELEEIGVEGLRAHFRMVGHADGPLRDGVSAETIAVPGPNGDVPTRIYRPSGTRPRGVYIHTHHGGYVAMNGLDHVDGYNSNLALEWDCIVVHPDFRVPPEHKYPAGVEDCWAVVQWAAMHIDWIGGDLDRVAVGGGCTGASMAAVMAIMARDAGGPQLAAQFLYAPQLDARGDYRSRYEFARGYGLTRASTQWVTDQYLNDPEERWDWRVSPVLAPTLRGVAPAVMSVGEWDVLSDEARFYANRLQDAGVPVTYIEGPSQGHSHTSWRNPATGELTTGARADNARIAEAMRSYIGPAAEAQHS
ncbi:alpha/beta hydrolase [Rhodococcus qingshengii]|uniref:alpha/beta hydrolase n=1 Tax=Rhodococcus qingshengii TaxID=334542 RepID=UPI0035DB0526